MKMLLKLNFVFLLFMLSCAPHPLASNKPSIPTINYTLKYSTSTSLKAKARTVDGNKVVSPIHYQVDITEAYIKTLHELMYFCESAQESELKAVPALIVKVFEDIQDGDALAYNVSSQHLEDYLQSVQHPAAIKALNGWFTQNDLPYTIPYTTQD